MCDFSAKSAKQRAARKADRLVTKAISPHTRGFVDLSAQDTAVCLLPGTELAFAKPIKTDPDQLDQTHGHQATVLDYSVAKFVQVDKNNEMVHHDALQLPDGTVVLLDVLAEGQQAAVLQLPAEPKTLAEAHEQQRAEYV